MTRLSALVALLLLAVAIGAHLTSATATTTLPCYGSIILPQGSTHISTTNPACKGAHEIVATVQGIGSPEGVGEIIATMTPTGKLSVHVSSPVGVEVAYVGF
jgi:curli biogenesis system outer membrane secretion channel CsgG